MLDFGKIEEVFAQTAPAAEELRQKLLQMLPTGTAT
jgi:hypothetical protein